MAAPAFETTSNKQRYPLTGIERHSRLFFLAALLLLSPLASSAVEQVAPLTAPIYDRVSGTTSAKFSSLAAMQANMDAYLGGSYVKFEMVPTPCCGGAIASGRGVGTGLIWPPSDLPYYRAGDIVYYVFVTPPACPVPVSGSPYTFNPQSGMCERPCPDPATGAPCLCETVYEFGVPRNSCIVGKQEQYTLTLSPASATIEPGKTYPFTATVMKQGGGAPDKPVPVSVKVEVNPTSGGHGHGETYAIRNKGSVSPATGNTSFPITFTSTEVSGTHTITATCDMCVNKTATAKVEVKVPGLEPIPASPYYVLEEPDTVNGGMKPIGATDKHKDNHNVTAKAKAGLRTLGFFYNIKINRGKKLYINDASLPWGGLMDDDGNWAPPHETHRRGDAIDIRAASSAAKPGEIPTTLFTQVQNVGLNGVKPEIHCYTSTGTLVIATAANPARCNNLNRGRHFHVIFK